MTKFLLALTSVSLLCLSGCADTYATKADSKPAAATATVAAQPALSAEAQTALSAAQAAAKDAKAKNALWTTADAALKSAEAAAAAGDSAAVLKQAKLVNDHVQKGLAQLNYPMLKVGD